MPRRGNAPEMNTTGVPQGIDPGQNLNKEFDK